MRLDREVNEVSSKAPVSPWDRQGGHLPVICLFPHCLLVPHKPQALSSAFAFLVSGPAPCAIFVFFFFYFFSSESGYGVAAASPLAKVVSFGGDILTLPFFTVSSGKPPPWASAEPTGTKCFRDFLAFPLFPVSLGASPFWGCDRLASRLMLLVALGSAAAACRSASRSSCAGVSSVTAACFQATQPSASPTRLVHLVPFRMSFISEMTIPVLAHVPTWLYLRLFFYYVIWVGFEFPLFPISASWFLGLRSCNLIGILRFIKLLKTRSLITYIYVFLKLKTDFCHIRTVFVFTHSGSFLLPLQGIGWQWDGEHPIFTAEW